MELFAKARHFVWMLLKDARVIGVEMTEVVAVVVVTTGVVEEAEATAVVAVEDADTMMVWQFYNF